MEQLDWRDCVTSPRTADNLVVRVLTWDGGRSYLIQSEDQTWISLITGKSRNHWAKCYKVGGTDALTDENSQDMSTLQ